VQSRLFNSICKTWHLIDSSSICNWVSGVSSWVRVTVVRGRGDSAAGTLLPVPPVDLCDRFRGSRWSRCQKAASTFRNEAITEEWVIWKVVSQLSIFVTIGSLISRFLFGFVEIGPRTLISKIEFGFGGILNPELKAYILIFGVEQICRWICSKIGR
jgi:hypothetical protein